MVAGELNAPATRECWSLDDVDARTVLALHVAVTGREILRPSIVQIARDGKCLEKYFGHDHGTAQIQDDAPVIEIGDRGREAFEIAMTRSADCRAVG